MTGEGALADWDPERYDADHAFVSEYGEEVVGLLAPAPGERILDLGCGTGHLTAEIASSGADVVGLDRSRGMLETARAEYPDLPFVRADARRFAFAESFDAVFTNATLHWIDEPERAFESVASVLRPGGRFVGEFGGRGNVATIVGAVMNELGSRGYDTQHPLYFPSVGEFTGSLEPHGFEVRRVELFDRPVELAGDDGGLRSWLTMFGDALFAPVVDDERQAIVSAVEDRLRPEQFRDGSWIADYRRLRFVAVRT